MKSTRGPATGCPECYADYPQPRDARRSPALLRLRYYVNDRARRSVYCAIINERRRKRASERDLRGLSCGSGGGIRTRDLWVMSPTSCRCSTPRCREPVGGSDVRATASPPTRSPAQYSPALAPGTTRFGMGRGGIGAARGHAHPRPANWAKSNHLSSKHGSPCRRRGSPHRRRIRARP
jgi:hypothetical protein